MSKNKERGGCGGIFGLFWLFMIIRGCISGGDDTDKVPNYVDSDEIEITGPTISHNLDWSDTEHPDKNYTGTVTLNTEDHYSSKKNKESYWYLDRNGNVKNSKNAFTFLKEGFVWNRDVSSYKFDDDRWNSDYLKPIGIKEGYSYMKSYSHDKSKLNFIYSLFDDIQKEQRLSKYEFADMIVSFVQNIEYSIPATTDCETAYKQGGVVKDMIDEGYSCDGNVAFGFYAPIEFIGNWTGDCDTRSVFLYTVLKHYGYDVVILNSDMYSHSILGINLTPLEISNPLYKLYNRKKYYVWEATSPVPLGILNPTIANMYYWDVVLDNNLNLSITSL